MHLNKSIVDLPKASHSKLIVFPLEVSQAERLNEKKKKMNFS